MDFETVLLYFIIYMLIEELKMQQRRRRRVLYVMYVRLGRTNDGQVSS